ncbi:MAG: hypothetical protein WBK55_00085 [Alphaproteobacteria bacterium]
MSIYSYDPSNRYRRRSMQRMAGFSVALLCMLAGGALGFFLGRQDVFRDEIVMSSRLDALTSEKQELENAMTELRAEALTATTRYEELQKTYAETMPEGPVQDLITLVHKQIADGMDPGRLAFLIRSARPPRNCTEPETQRFVVSTPAYKGPESKASITEGAIAIKGNGVSARNAKGDPEAWYDPSKAVTLDFVLKDGRAETKKGVMPIHQSLVFGDKEYRFTVTEGARSFAKVTFDRCDYP